MWGIYRKRGCVFYGRKVKETKKFCGWKIAYTGRFCPSTGKDKSGKLVYFPSTGTENNILLLTAAAHIADGLVAGDEHYAAMEFTAVS